MVINDVEFYFSIILVGVERNSRHIKLWWNVRGAIPRAVRCLLHGQVEL